MEPTLFPLPEAVEVRNDDSLRGVPRLLTPNRTQVEFRAMDMDGLLPADHLARLVWDFVVAQDLSELYEGIRSVEGGPGHSATDPRQGQEDQLGALGLVVNAIASWNTDYMGEILAELTRHGEPKDAADVARLSPMLHAHFNLLGHYRFELPAAVSPTAQFVSRDTAVDHAPT